MSGMVSLDGMVSNTSGKSKPAQATDTALALAAEFRMLCSLESNAGPKELDAFIEKAKAHISGIAADDQDARSSMRKTDCLTILGAGAAITAALNYEHADYLINGVMSHLMQIQEHAVYGIGDGLYKAYASAVPSVRLLVLRDYEAVCSPGLGTDNNWMGTMLAKHNEVFMRMFEHAILPLKRKEADLSDKTYTDEQLAEKSFEEIKKDTALSTFKPRKSVTDPEEREDRLRKGREGLACISSYYRAVNHAAHELYEFLKAQGMEQNAGAIRITLEILDKYPDGSELGMELVAVLSDKTTGRKLPANETARAYSLLTSGSASIAVEGAGIIFGKGSQI